jgi:hypothetical protein
MKTIGVFTIDPWTLLEESSMKTELLYFDHLKFFIRGKEILEKICTTLPNGKDLFITRMRELEELEKLGLISEYSLELHDNHFTKFRDQKTLELSRKHLQLAQEFLNGKKSSREMFVDFLERFREIGHLEARTNTIFLNKAETDEFVPIIRGNYYNCNEDYYLKKATVISVIIKNFPRIKSDISSERLLDLKNDAEVRFKLNRLKNWAIDLTSSKLTEKEINQRIEYFLLEYQKQLDLHKLKYEIGIVETFVNVGLEVLENIIKLNLSKVAQVFFDIKKKELTLLEAEEKLIGKEVAYLQHINKKIL